MAADIGCTLASGVIKVVLGQIGSTMGAKMKLHSNSKHDLEKMKTTLESAEALLNEAEKRSITDASTRLWLNLLKDAMYDISYMLDDFEAQPHLWSGVVRKITMPYKMKKMRERLENVRQMRLRYLLLVTTSGSNSKRTASTDAAALSYVAYDKYVLHGDCEVVHADDGIPLEHYKKINPMVVEYNMFSVENGFHVLPGETNEPMVYRIASEQSKKITRTILKSLWRNELRSLCFTQFAESNIVVNSSGKAKFRNISVIRNLTGHDLLQRQMSNYLSAHTIIEDLFSGNPPEDIQHLLSLIKQEFVPRELFHIHGSLLPVAMHSTLFKAMYDHIRFVLPAEDLRAILGSLPYVGTWKSQIGTNELLKIPFNRNPKSYVVPSDKQGQTCLNKFQKDALKDLGLTQQPHQKSLSKDEIKLIEALQFINYLRNKTSHRMEPCKKWTENNKAYDAQGSEMVTYVRFPLIIPYMQLQLCNRKMHHEISMDKFF